MDKLRRTLSFRKKVKKVKDGEDEWKEDERKVRAGTCCFHVKYLGCIEVFEATGMRVCEEAVRLLRNNAKRSERLSFRKKRNSPCPVSALIYITGDSLRVVENNSIWDRKMSNRDDSGQGLIVDQTVEKVSFCAPDRNHMRGFAYICRDGTTRRWMCHGFITLKETGERLSHAIGCAFAVCLEKKQKREKELVEVEFNPDKTCFERQGSFRQTSLTERMADPQSAIIPEPLCPPAVTVPTAFDTTACVERPRPSAPGVIRRQGSFTEFSKLNSTSSAFKRNPSLRLDDLPSTLKRQAEDADCGQASASVGDNNGGKVSTTEWDPITAMCQQLTTGLFTLNHSVGGLETPPSAGQQSVVHMTNTPLESVPSESSGLWGQSNQGRMVVDHQHSNRFSFEPSVQHGRDSSNPFLHEPPLRENISSGNPFLHYSNQPAAAEFIINI